MFLCQPFVDHAPQGLQKTPRHLCAVGRLIRVSLVIRCLIASQPIQPKLVVDPTIHPCRGACQDNQSSRRTKLKRMYPIPCPLQESVGRHKAERLYLTLTLARSGLQGSCPGR
jgi:hypothetical protein